VNNVLQIAVMQQQRRDAHIRCKTTDPLLTQSLRLHPTTPKPIFLGCVYTAGTGTGFLATGKPSPPFS